MNALQWLGRYRVFSYQVERCERALIEARDKLTNITPKYSGQPVSGTADPHKFDAIIEKASELTAKRHEADRAREEIATAIAFLSDERERKALSLYYLRGLNWPDVSREMGYSVRNVLYIRADALEHIEPFIKTLC